METIYDFALADNGRGILFTQTSPIHGHGLFTAEDLPFNTILCRRLGLRSELSLRDKRAIIGIDGLDPGEPDDSIFKCINHCCLANAVLTDTGCLVSTQKLAAETEITVDYTLLLAGTDWELICHCGRPKCRHLIKSIL